MDVHKDSISLAVRNAAGKIVMENLSSPQPESRHKSSRGNNHACRTEIPRLCSCSDCLRCSFPSSGSNSLSRLKQHNEHSFPEALENAA